MRRPANYIERLEADEEGPGPEVVATAKAVLKLGAERSARLSEASERAGLELDQYALRVLNDGLTAAIHDAVAKRRVGIAVTSQAVIQAGFVKAGRSRNPLDRVMAETVEAEVCALDEFWSGVVELCSGTTTKRKRPLVDQDLLPDMVGVVAQNILEMISEGDCVTDAPWKKFHRSTSIEDTFVGGFPIIERNNFGI